MSIDSRSLGSHKTQVAYNARRHGAPLTDQELQGLIDRATVAIEGINKKSQDNNDLFEKFKETLTSMQTKIDDAKQQLIITKEADEEKIRNLEADIKNNNIAKGNEIKELETQMKTVIGLFGDLENASNNNITEEKQLVEKMTNLLNSKISETTASNE